jgi:hypothetical protein
MSAPDRLRKCSDVAAPPNKALQLTRPCSGLMTYGSVWHWNLGASLGVNQQAVQLSA